MPTSSARTARRSSNKKALSRRRTRTTAAPTGPVHALEVNPFLAGALEGENLKVRQLARVFNTKDPHSRRALLKWAAIFAGVSQEEAYLLGRNLGDFVVRGTAQGLARRRQVAADMRRWWTRQRQRENRRRRTPHRQGPQAHHGTKGGAR